MWRESWISVPTAPLFPEFSPCPSSALPSRWFAFVSWRIKRGCVGSRRAADLLATVGRSWKCHHIATIGSLIVPRTTLLYSWRGAFAAHRRCVSSLIAIINSKVMMISSYEEKPISCPAPKRYYPWSLCSWPLSRGFEKACLSGWKLTSSISGRVVGIYSAFRLAPTCIDLSRPSFRRFYSFSCLFSGRIGR
jgi:hypothetical protein